MELWPRVAATTTRIARLGFSGRPVATIPREDLPRVKKRTKIVWEKGKKESEIWGGSGEGPGEEGRGERSGEGGPGKN